VEPGQVFPLEKVVTNIGRAIDNDVVLDDERASRYHARITWAAGTFSIEDLGSRNGTQVKGQRLAAAQSLQTGDVISLPGLIVVFQTARAAETVAETHIADLNVDEVGGFVTVRGQQVALTAKEFLAITLLNRRAGGLVRKNELAEYVWPEYEGAVGDYNIEQLISRVRRKIEDDPKSPRFLFTVRGLGYRLTVR
jgi:pSer/pThr/pTyr-binding forkhead associated (FHA) protein